MHATLPAEALGWKILVNADWDLNTERTSISANQRNKEIADGLFALLEILFRVDETLRVRWGHFLPRGKAFSTGSFSAGATGVSGESAMGAVTARSFLMQRLEEW